MLHNSEDHITKQCVVTERQRTQTVLLVIVKMARGSENYGNTNMEIQNTAELSRSDLHWWIHLSLSLFYTYTFNLHCCL